jgi:hypothetical protein
LLPFPLPTFNPDDSIVFVNPARDCTTMMAIATLWHDHFVEEYTVKAAAIFTQKIHSTAFPQHRI